MIYRNKNVIMKMKEQKIKTLSMKEIDRVFKDTVAPKICKRAVLKMLKDGLNINEIKNL